MREEQLDWLVGAREARDEAIGRAVRHADEIKPEWSEIAHNALLAFLDFSGVGHIGGFTAEDVREWATVVPEPPDRRAWGGILQRAARSGRIVKRGYVTHRDPSRHCAPSTLWRRANEIPRSGA